MLTIYTDGSCLNNGKTYALGGIGIYIPEKNFKYSQNSEEVYRSFFINEMVYIHTNQKSELLAILKSLDLFKNSIENIIMIKTDSMYSINCIQKWSKSWLKNNWKTSAGKSVKNKEIIEKILDTVKEMKQTIMFEHVKAHADNENNNMADELSRECLV